MTYKFTKCDNCNEYLDKYSNSFYRGKEPNLKFTTLCTKCTDLLYRGVISLR